MSDDRVFTAQDIIDGVMNHHRGCIEGKHEFLRDAFAIEPNENWSGDYRVICTAYVRVKPNRIHAADMADEEGLILSVDEYLERNFRADNLSDNVTGADIIDGWAIAIERITPVEIVNDAGERTAMDLR
jgi:hypothetical protein